MIRCRKQMCLVTVLAFGLLIGFSAAGAVDTTTAVTTSPPGPVVVGQAVTVTWTLTAQTSSAVAFCGSLSRRIKSPGSGTWNILDDTDTASGGSPFTSTYPLTPLVAGTYTIEGGYAGCPTSDPILNASTGSALLTVNKADTTTSVVSDLASPVTGQTITFTATVAATSPGTGTPTGSVTFYAVGTPIPGGQNVVLVDDGSGNQIAQCTAAYNFSDSAVSITAAYGGDADYNGSDNTASPLSQAIVKAATTTSLSSSKNTAGNYPVTGEFVTFIAIVEASGNGSGTPTGTVTFHIEDTGGTALVADPVVSLDGSGHATYMTNLMKAIGSAYSVTGTYNPPAVDANYTTSGGTLSPSQTVNKADTSITIISDSADPSFEDESYTVTWSVVVDGPGSDAPIALGNTVTVIDQTGATSGAVAVGAETCSLTSTTDGAKTLKATYSGDDNYNSSDTTESHTVNTADTSVVVSSDINPSVIGQLVTFTATITPAATGGDPIGGTADFFIDDADPDTLLCDDVAVSNGVAECSHTFTAAGSYAVYAVYNGDGKIKDPELFTYNGSTSASYAQTVDNADTSVVISNGMSLASTVTVVGESYDVTGMVSVDSPGGGVTSTAGEVSVSDGSAACTDTSLIWDADHWDWTCSLTSTTAGMKTITATFNPDVTDDLNSSIGTASHQVNEGAVSIGIDPVDDCSALTPITTWNSGDSGCFTATVAAAGDASGSPTGSVTFVIKDQFGVTIDTSGPHLLSSGSACSDSVTLTTAQSPVSVEVTYSGDTNFSPATNTLFQSVAGSTPGVFTISDDSPDPSLVGVGFDVTVAYDPKFPSDGFVYICITGPSTAINVVLPVLADALTLSLSDIPLVIDPSTAGLYEINARYHPGSDDFGSCSYGGVGDELAAMELHTVYACTTATSVSCDPSWVYVNEPTTITAIVTVTDPSPCSPSGLAGTTVSFASVLPAGGDGDFSSDYCILVSGVDSAYCSSATFTPTASGADCGADPEDDYGILATFSGGGDYLSSSGGVNLTVAKRPAAVTVACAPDSVYIDQETTCTVTVDDGTVAPGSTIPAGSVTFGDGPKAGAFAPSDTGSLTHGTYDVAYTPAAGDAGTTMIDADYGGSEIYCATASPTTDLNVMLRPTETTLTWEDSQGGNDAIFLYETGRVIITVTDIGPADSASPPQGTLSVVGPTFGCSGLTPISANASVATCSFKMLTSTEAQAFVPVIALYTPYVPQTHDGSSGSTDVSVQKRTTEAAVVCQDAVNGNCTVTVTDTAPRGEPRLPVGFVVDQADGDNFCTLATAGPGTLALCSNQVLGDSMMQPFAVGYDPTDNIHLGSYAMDLIERPLEADDDDCGTLHIEDSIFGLNTACTILAALQVLLDSGAAAADIIADPVWTAIFPGSTVPIGDMIAAGLTGLSLHGEIAIQTMCTDVDGDGIPGSVEAVIAGLEDHKWDSDGDGMGDLDEIDESSGDMAENYDASKYASCACPDPTTPDSDGDDMLDGAELMGGPHRTSNCDPDTDDDGLIDSQEVGTYSTYASASGAGETIDPRDDPRDHCNPVVADTDGDGLSDDMEFTPGRLATSTSDLDYSSYVNDADSDDDGVQDGAEDTNGDGRWSGTIGGTTSPGIGETHLCMWDTDGDGLSDGQELALFGAGDVHVVTPTGSTTVPANDTDSDNDGLSDYEEVNITKTDPLDFDTDDDGLWDVNELRATGGTWPARSFSQVSDPLDPDTDDDDIPDNVEYDGTELGTEHGLGGSDDTKCPYVNDDDSDNDGLQDGVEDANHDGFWGIGGSGITIGSFGTQASKSVEYWECDPCNPDTDGDGIRDGEEVNLIGGGPIFGRPIPTPGFYTVTPEGRSTVVPEGPFDNGGPLFTFTPTNGLPIGVTVPALDVDSDNDGLSDYEEVMVTGTDPLDADSDNDTLMDSDELIATGGSVNIPGNPGTGPRRTFDQESDPLDINTDDDHLFDPVEGECGNIVNTGTGLSGEAGGLGGVRDTTCPYINDDDSDDDGVQDGAVVPISRTGPGMTYSYTFFEGFEDVPDALDAPPGSIRTIVTAATGEQELSDDVCNACDPDSDGDGLTDGEEIGIGTDPSDWDTDDDGRNDWHEMTGGGPIPTDPFDPDTDDDGLLDSAEVFGSNPTNPVNADTDGDGLCDGGAGTPYMTSSHATVTVNPICKSCSEPGNTSCGTSVRTGSADGIGDHPNPMGLGEDENGNGTWDGGETDPNQYDTDGDADGDGIEKLGFSTSRQSTIPSTDMLGQAISVTYPDCGCLDPLNPDTDGDGISDGIEDLNHDGNFDFNISDFDFQDLLDGAPQPDPEETNPCDPDTDNDGLTDYDERYQTNPAVFYPYNPTNPLDHDTDNDYLFDGEEVNWTCIDPGFDLDPNMDGIIDYFVMTVLGDVLDPTNRDSDSDGFIDGLDPNPCYSWLIPIGKTLDDEWTDEDGDGFSDADELAAGTDPNNADDYPVSFIEDLDLDTELDDVLWLEDYNGDGIVDSVAIDLESDGLVDARVGIVKVRDLRIGDFDEDGFEDDVKLVVVYAFTNGRYIQPRVVLTVIDLDTDFVVDEVSFAE